MGHNIKEMKIIGIDPGTATLGFGVIEYSNAKSILVDGGVIKTSPDDSDADRLKTIFDELSGVIENVHPEAMAIEKLFFAQNVTTAMTVSQARGVVMLLGKQGGMEVYEYTPLQIKQAITGYGRATKSQMQEMVRVLLGLKTIPKPDDCADALAAALCHGASSSK